MGSTRVVIARGQARAIFNDQYVKDYLPAMPAAELKRASHVELVAATAPPRFSVDLSPIGGPVLTEDEEGKPFMQYGDALAFEQRWIDKHWMREESKPLTQAGHCLWVVCKTDGDYLSREIAERIRERRYNPDHYVVAADDGNSPIQQLAKALQHVVECSPRQRRLDGQPVVCITSSDLQILYDMFAGFRVRLEPLTTD